MSSRGIDPVWGDDLMAIADAVGATYQPEPIHPSVRGHLTDQALSEVLTTWSSEIGDEDVIDDYLDHPDKPITYWPTDLDGYDPENRSEWR